MDELIRQLASGGVLRSQRIKSALEKIDRKDFVTPENKRYAYEDTALPILAGQTISQPYTVVFMLELLQAKPGDILFEAGYGSGWQTALLGEIVGSSGKIYAMEIVPELCDFGKKNIEKYPQLKNRISLYCASAHLGLPEAAKDIQGFDGIITAAEVSEVPSVWRDQLKDGGRMAYPKASSIFRETKNGDRFAVDEFPGFAFVPFRQ